MHAPWGITWTSGKTDDERESGGPPRGLWSTAGGEFPDPFGYAWKRLICWKTAFPQSSHWTTPRVWLEICHSFCQCIVSEMLAGLACHMPCPRVGKHKFLPFFPPKAPLLQGLEALILEELCSKVSGRPTNPQTKSLSPPIWRKQ